ncbi:MAG: hypothetical protein Kow00109_23310 [Acidobacteriota bacterium]
MRSPGARNRAAARFRLQRGEDEEKLETSEPRSPQRTTAVSAVGFLSARHEASECESERKLPPLEYGGKGPQARRRRVGCPSNRATDAPAMDSQRGGAASPSRRTP